MALQLRRLGLHRVRPLGGGIEAWLAARLPVDPLAREAEPGAPGLARPAPPC